MRPDPVTTGSARVEDPDLTRPQFSSAQALAAHRSPSFLSALERVMYRPQFVKIAADNAGIGIVKSLDAARAALGDDGVATVAGKLADGLLAADIDADDPLIGDVCAEALIAWCIEHDMPYLLRESGRSGGRHVVAVVPNSGVPVKEWARLCRTLARQYRVTVQNRTGQVLRLLSAPHRIGLPAPVIACTLTPAIVMDAHRFRRATAKTKARTAAHSPTTAGETGDADSSRSGHEFGIACAMARAGWTVTQAWEAIRAEDGKAAELGRAWFLRYQWERAVTIAAAEDALTETDAWDLVTRECPGTRTRGRDAWRYWWRRALTEAALDRPRRYRLPDAEATGPVLPPEIAAALDATRQGLREAAEAALAQADPRHRHSVHAALYALAYAVVTRDGAMSIRMIAERARIDTKTVRAALATAIAGGLLLYGRRYGGGARDCDSYVIGPAALHPVSAAHHGSSPTRCTTPAPLGSASPARLRAQHALDRRGWKLRCDVLATLAPGERLADSRHPAAKLLRSLWHQRTWWKSLTPEQQQERREHRRAMLRKLDQTDRSAWFSWLERRELIANAADRINAARPTEDDPQTVLAVPVTLHRGMADPRWREHGYSTGAAQLAA
ncbi:hypothetical protein [Nocardia tengchongensis]|uniref:hypothetical protein n=1 Tax=Nocardia tengchongensis TaxID=2055889 RepID=UPI0036D3256D